jgi:hypothetical protein
MSMALKPTTRDYQPSPPYDAHVPNISYQVIQDRITDIILFLEKNDEYAEGVLTKEVDARKRVADFVTAFTVVVRTRHC